MNSKPNQEFQSLLNTEVASTLGIKNDNHLSLAIETLKQLAKAYDGTNHNLVLENHIAQLNAAKPAYSNPTQARENFNILFKQLEVYFPVGYKAVIAELKSQKINLASQINIAYAFNYQLTLTLNTLKQILAPIEEIEAPSRLNMLDISAYLFSLGYLNEPQHTSSYTLNGEHWQLYTFKNYIQNNKIYFSIKVNPKLESTIPHYRQLNQHITAVLPLRQVEQTIPATNDSIDNTAIPIEETEDVRISISSAIRPIFNQFSLNGTQFFQLTINGDGNCGVVTLMSILNIKELNENGIRKTREGIAKATLAMAHARKILISLAEYNNNRISAAKRPILKNFCKALQKDHKWYLYCINVLRKYKSNKIGQDFVRKSILNRFPDCSLDHQEWMLDLIKTIKKKYNKYYGKQLLANTIDKLNQNNINPGTLDHGLSLLNEFLRSLDEMPLAKQAILKYLSSQQIIINDDAGSRKDIIKNNLNKFIYLLESILPYPQFDCAYDLDNIITGADRKDWTVTNYVEKLKNSNTWLSRLEVLSYLAFNGYLEYPFSDEEACTYSLKNKNWTLFRFMRDGHLIYYSLDFMQRVYPMTRRIRSSHFEAVFSRDELIRRIDLLANKISELS